MAEHPDADLARPDARERRVWVSIVHYNGGAGTLACIESVLASTHRALSIVLVDNASTDGIANVVEERWPAVAVLRNATNSGFTGGQNRGMAFAMENGAEHVMLLNQDAIVDATCVERLVALAEADPRNGLVSPVVYFADQPQRVQFCGSWMDWDAMAIRYSGEIPVLRTVDADPAVTLCLWGTALLVRREVVDAIGYLDDRLFAYFEDTDYSVRAARAGWRNRMAFDAAIWHEGHPTRVTRAPNFFYFTCRNELLFWLRTVPSRQRLRALRLSVARVAREAARLRDAGLGPQVAACMLGLWHALTRRVGAFDARSSAPRWFTRALMWHPYLAADLLEGDLAALTRARPSASER